MKYRRQRVVVGDARVVQAPGAHVQRLKILLDAHMYCCTVHAYLQAYETEVWGPKGGIAGRGPVGSEQVLIPYTPVPSFTTYMYTLFNSMPNLSPGTWCDSIPNCLSYIQGLSFPF